MKRWLMPLCAVMAIGLLSGCTEQVESLLEKANLILDQQLEKDEPEQGTSDKKENNKTEGNTNSASKGNNKGNEQNKNKNNDQEENNEEVNSDVVKDDGQGHGPDNDQLTTVEDLIDQGVYESIDPPNGYPLPIPLAEWHLVQMIKDPEDGHEAWEGVFCFNTEIESTIYSYEQQLIDEGFEITSEPIDSDDVPDAKHSTKFEYNREPGVILEGDMNYHIDHYGNGCTKVYFVFNYE